MKLIISMLLIMSFSSYSCDYPAHVNKEDIVECTGVIMTESQFVESANNRKDLRLIKIELNHMQDIDGLRQEQVKRAKKRASELELALTWQETKSTFMVIGSFIAGALVTGYIAKETLK